MIGRVLHAVLASPPARAVKRPFRDLLWMVKGRSVPKPVVPGEVRSILFVCQGNICRSPFAARLARRLLDEHGRRDIVTASGGLRTNQAAAPPIEARVAARAFDVTLDDHVPVQMTPDFVDSFDLVAVMEVAQLESLRTSFPRAAAKAVLLPLFATRPPMGYDHYNIADPFGRPQAEFDRCYAHIQATLEGVVSRVAPPGTSKTRRDSANSAQAGPTDPSFR